MRYVLEGTWSGYHSVQRRVVHREVIRKPIELSCIQYTDGTTLQIYVREARPRERVQEINGYGSLIRQALRLNKSFVTVNELQERHPT
jgi:hypothetical protein